MSRSKRNSNFNPDLKTVTVEPGSVTGLYYIPVANASIRSITLDHGTTWQDLKQFASQVCEVDYADIYSPTSGLVRVKGRENFEKCFQHLNGNILHLRSIQADDRNRDYPTVVRLPQTDFHAARIIEGRTGSSYSHSTHPSYDAAAGTSSTAYQTYSNCTSSPPTASTSWGYNITASPSNYGSYSSNDEYMHQSMTDPSATATTTDYAYPSYQPVPPEYDYSASTASTAASSSSYQQYQALQPQDSVILDLRKIVILNLERKRLSIPYVADIILNYTGIGVQHGEIEKIEVPTNHNGRARGTTYVTFASHDLAASTVQALNEREVNGKKLVARLTEGVSRGTVSTGGGEEGGKKKEDKGGGSGRRQGGDGRQGALIEEGPPVIVDGTVGWGGGRGNR